MHKDAIISPRNILTEEINNVVLNIIEGESQEYKSVDTVIEHSFIYNTP